MRVRVRNNLHIVLILFFALLSSCAKYPAKPIPQNVLAYTAEEGAGLLSRYAPVFVAEETHREYNRIGTPVATFRQEQENISVDPAKGTIYTDIRSFSTQKGDYLNLYYRIHFAEVPMSLVPFHLGAGENVGLLAVVTLNQQKEPVLYTLVHTCGCYLAFIATSHLPRESWKSGWENGRQRIFGENLPTVLDFTQAGPQKVAVNLRSGTHRVKNVWLMTGEELSRFELTPLKLMPFEALEQLALPDGNTTSFYEITGARRGYVKGSYKTWERLLISWWAFDSRVGQDKKLGENSEDGIVFYTSLKPWAREESDMRDFSGFLHYWGWRL